MSNTFSPILKKISYKKDRRNHYIFVPGFLSQSSDYSEYLKFLKKKDHNVSVLIWGSSAPKKEFFKFTGNSFALGIPFGSYKFFRTWKSANENTLYDSDFLYSKLIKLKNQNIYLMGHSLGCKLIYNTISTRYIPNIRKVIFLGAALSSKAKWGFLRNRSFGVINYYNPTDRVLKYFYKTAELRDIPIGLTEAKFRNRKCQNIECIEHQHNDYKHEIEHLLSYI